MPTVFETYGAQAALLCLLAALPVFILWSGRRGDHRWLWAGAGLLCFSLAGGFSFVGRGAVWAPACVTLGLFAFNAAMCVHRARRPAYISGGLLLGLHVMVLLNGPAGYAPREATTHLVWSVFGLITCTKLASVDEDSLSARDPYLFPVFLGHTIFCFVTSSLLQLQFASVAMSWFNVLVFSELVILAGALVLGLFLTDMRARALRLHALLRESRLKAGRVAAAAAGAAAQPGPFGAGFPLGLAARGGLTPLRSLVPDSGDTVPLRASARRSLAGSVPPFPFPQAPSAPVSRELAQAE